LTAVENDFIGVGVDAHTKSAVPSKRISYLFMSLLLEGIGNIFSVKYNIDIALEKRKIKEENGKVEEMDDLFEFGIDKFDGLEGELRRKWEKYSQSSENQSEKGKSTNSNPEVPRSNSSSDSFLVDNASQKFVLHFLQNYLYHLMESVGHPSEMVFFSLT
jgi:hypothetical protein